MDHVAVACRAIDSAEVPPTLAHLAKAAGLSKFHFLRVFKRHVGLTPKQYALSRRADLLRSELPRRSSVTDALYRAGFNSSSRLYENSEKILGMSPARYRKGGEGETIEFGTARSSLGFILVARSVKGVCAILLGDNADVLVTELQARFPRATIVGGSKNFRAALTKVVAHVETPHPQLKLPLDLRGTAFQRRVWQALQRIPPGTTSTYTDVARDIGQPGAVRAVARACAANTLAVAVPCHRVIRTSGAISGYRWGIDRKRRLLAKEKFPAAGKRRGTT